MSQSMFNIGGVRSEVWPFPVSQFEDAQEFPFAVHEILLGGREHERVTQRQRNIRMGGKVLPRAVGGERELELLEALHTAGETILVFQGRRKLGWFKITRFRREHFFIDDRGVGRKIDFKIEMESTGKPTAAGAASMLTRLFGYA